MNRILAIDYGKTNLGLAISDTGGSFAMPLKVLKNNKNIESEIKSIVEEYTVAKIVLGVPQNFESHENSINHDIEQFRQKLAKILSIPIDTQDESYSTHVAEGLLRQQGINSKKQKGKADMYSAMLILNEYLNND